MKKTSRRIRAEEEWILIPVPPVLDRDLFSRVQAKLKANFELAPRNKKHEYLLSGALWCSCGARRTGSGARGGKNLYYTCIGRIKSFPIPSTCTERVINARIADDLVWRKIVQLMSSPELMRKQAERWFQKQRGKTENTNTDFRAIEKEIAKLRNEEDRYNKAYGAGMFTIDQLKDYTAPVRDKVASLQTQMATAAARQIPEVALPDKQQIEDFAQKATVMLKSLKFAAKQAIVRGVIEKGVVSQGEITVTGRIPVEINQANSNVAFCSIHRHRGTSERREIDAF